MKTTGVKRFPVLGTGRTISWKTAQRAYSVYSNLYSNGQTLERLAERGGFAESELDDLYQKWREEEEYTG